MNIFRKGVELFFVAAASVVFALAGFLLSILAHVIAALHALKDSTGGPAHLPESKPPLLPTDTPVIDSHAAPASEHESRRVLSLTEPLLSSPEPVWSSLSNGQLTASLPHSPHAQNTTHTRRAVKKRSRPTLPRPTSQIETPVVAAIEDTMTEGGSDPAIPDREGLSKCRSMSTNDSSSINTNSSEELPLDSRGVFKKIRDHHSHLRERCISRTQSLPLSKPRAQRPVRRTNPYQAPYFFPTPLSPEADTYVRDVLSERSGGVLKVAPTSPSRSTTLSVETASSPSSSVGPVIEVSEGEQPERRPGVNHRWSLHLPLKRPQTSPRTRSADPAERRMSGDRESGARSIFGHHRKRNGVSSHDAQPDKTS